MKYGGIMKIIPYVTLQGECGAAIEFYQKIFNATVLEKQLFSAAPKDAGAFPIADKNWVLHSVLSIDGQLLMLGDFPPSFKIAHGETVTICLAMQNKDKMKEVFAGLSKGGLVKIPLEKVFFNPLYGMVRDKFGIVWQLILEEEKK